MTWILIAYFYTGYHGGPIAVRFDDRPACEAALTALRTDKSMKLRYDVGICVPASTEGGR